MSAMIVSTAHSWAQALPLSANVMVCVDCGHSRAMSAARQKRPLLDQSVAIGVQTEINDRGLLLALYVLDRIGGEHRPLVPGLFECALNQNRKD